VSALLKIAWAPFAGEGEPSGYSVVTRELRLALQQAGAEIIGPYRWDWDCVVAVSLPTAWAVTEAGRPDVCWHTMFDMQTLPAAWLPILNRCGLVWVPSQWCQEMFVESGVTAPIMVAGYGVDQTTFYSINRRDRAGPLRFLAWGAGLVGRKNVLLAERAFQAASLPADQALLEIKVNAGASADYMLDADRQPKTNVSVHSADWTPRELADWLRSGDVLLYLSGGEGFGLQPLEGMATGLPVICAHNTGMTEYLTPETALLVETAGYQVSTSYSIRFDMTALQCRPDFDQTVAHIRWCAEHREAAYVIGERAAQAAAEWTWLRAGQVALKQLEARYG